MMKVLFIGGTGNISIACSWLATERGMELYILNRGKRGGNVPEGVRVLTGDINNEEQVAGLIKGMFFDAVVDFIAFSPEDVKRDVRLFSGKTAQYVLISSACIYRKPFSYWKAVESAFISNPIWPYANNKIECEKALIAEHLKSGFPFTIVRPSHTYSNTLIPVSLCGKRGEWAVADRMLKGKPVVVHGDGLTLWTVTHNTDFAKGLIGLLGNCNAMGESVHITSDEAVTWDSIYNIIGTALGTEPKLVHISTEMIGAFFPENYGHMMGDTAHCAVFDNTKIKRLVPEYTATMRADQGIRAAIKYHLAHKERQIQDVEFDQTCDNLVEAYHRFLVCGKTSE